MLKAIDHSPDLLSVLKMAFILTSAFYAANCISSLLSSRLGRPNLTHVLIADKTI
jgi:hypothetical protein